MDYQMEYLMDYQMEMDWKLELEEEFEDSCLHNHDLLDNLIHRNFLNHTYKFFVNMDPYCEAILGIVLETNIPRNYMDMF
jgi:hypothetical protein